ncbi:hypothetical protein AX16_007684 [Volvariella volvacea WC 439]|nr:hypothetical protein AX16_007684 [Volvariella volvacea WC 439]
MAHIPTEILLHFLSDLLPSFSTTEIFWPPAAESCHLRCKLICLAELATLRLVCWDWYQLIAPFLYSTFMFIIEPQKYLLKQAVVFQTHSNFVHHLIICSNILSQDRERRKTRFFDADVELLEACLGQCTNLQTLQLINAHDSLSKMAPNKLMKMLQSNRSSLSNLSRLIIGDDFSRCPQLIASKYLIGLGRNICDNLTSLEVSVDCPLGYRFGYPTPQCLYPLVTSFSNLSRLLLRWPGYGGDDIPKFYEKLISRVVKQETSQSGSIEGRHCHKRVVPLRELILDTYTPHRDYQWLDKTLNTNNLCSVLTILEIQLHTVYETHHEFAEEYRALPLHILDLCPSLHTFRFFSYVLRTIPALLPRRLNEVGLQVTSVLPGDHIFDYYPELTLMDLKPVIDCIRSDHGLKKIIVAFAHHKGGTNCILGSGVPDAMRQDWEILEQECEARDIMLSVFRGDSLECTRI